MDFIERFLLQSLGESFFKIGFCFLLIFLAAFSFDSQPIFADFQKDFAGYMNDWNRKRDLASRYLLDAERALKDGDDLLACAIQQKASKYGIEATESLIKAIKINGSTDDFDNLEAGLNKWREIGASC